MEYIFYWNGLHYILESRPVLQTSPFFLNYEKPVFAFLWSVWPLGHIILGVLLVIYWRILCGAVEPYRAHVRTDTEVALTAKAFPWLCAGVALFIMFGTLGGKALADYQAAERMYGAAVPRTPPPRPTDNQFWIKIDARRAKPVEVVSDAIKELRNQRGWIKFASIFLVPFALYFPFSLRYFFFSLAYGREMRKPHLPTEIVNRALAGDRIDHTALANAMTSSTAPMEPDSLRDKVERAKLAELASRLQADSQALNDKYSKEAEIARLVVSHARSRKELADMEQRLKDLGVQKHG